MEIIIFIAVVVVAALLWSGYVKTKKTESDRAIDSWQPPKAEDQSWPFPGGKVSEGTIHETVAEVAPVAVVPVAEPVAAQEVVPAKKTAAKKAPAKKAADPKPAAKKASAKKSST